MMFIFKFYIGKKKKMTSIVRTRKTKGGFAQGGE